jgi:hypothetical protein
MIELRFRGEMSTEPTGDPRIGSALPGAVTVKAAGQIQVERGAGQTNSLKAAPDDVLELELDGGVRWFVSVEQLHEDLGQSFTSVRGQPVLELPADLPWGDAERGLGARVGIVAFRLLDVNTELAAKTAQEIAEALEGRLEPEAGIYLCPQLDRFASLDKESSLAGGQPILVLIHGTASSTATSFGGLATDEAGGWSQLRGFYGERIVACEHRSLSESPIENALQLASALPTGAELHLLTHSRGGLIGELLCGGWRVDKRTHQLFKGRDQQLRQLNELEELLGARRFAITRFVRVACPARGTTLASRRLDRYLSLLIHAFGLLPHLGTNPIYELMTSFVLAVAKTRMDPEKLPGLEAMMPDSPLIQLLNGSAGPVAADLTVIAGDLKGESVTSWLKEWATSLFFRENHDLVVNTSAMLGGLRREKAGRYFFAQGREVSHFRYFDHDSPALGRNLWGLTRERGTGVGFESIEESTATDLAERSQGPSLDGKNGIVILLPDVLGTHLGVAGRRIWLEPTELAAGKLELLRHGAQDVETLGVIVGPYRDLAEYLRQDFEVVPFGYDWRLPPEKEAERLAALIRKRLGDSVGRPISLLAHASGGALARRMIANTLGLWNQVKATGGRLLQLGLPLPAEDLKRASLPARERLLHQLALVDRRHTRTEIEALLDQLPGLLPAPDHDFPFDSDSMSCVAGRDETSPPVPASQKSAFAAGTTSRWAGCQPWWVDANRGDLTSFRQAFRGYSDLLRSGLTSSLERTPTPSGIPDVEAAPDSRPEVEMYPDRTDLATAALGGRRASLGGATKALPIEVAVAHGNLAFVADAILLGHYEGDTLASAELFLDRHFGGRLSERRRLDLYPGRVGTAEVVFHPNGERRPPAGLIVGLGTVGDLTASKLEEGVTLALVKYAIKSLERPGATSEPLTLNVASLLIGTGDSMLSVEASVAAVVAGALAARERLERGETERRVRLKKLTFVELYLDRAIQAARAVETLRRRQQFAGAISTGVLLERLDGGRRRAYFDEDPSWWSRMKVESDRECPNGTRTALRFTLLTERARAEESQVPIDTRLVDGYVSKLMLERSRDPEVAGTLYELLIPNRLKDMAPLRRDQVLVLDEAAAAYPWELIHDRLRGDAEPLAVRAGLVRQLTRAEFRELPRPSLGDQALVVGDTQCPPSYPDLPGARREAQVVEGLLSAELGSQVKTLIKCSAFDFVQELFARPYRILHLAGHGVYHWNPDTDAPCGTEDGDCKCINGMVLGDRVFMTPATVEQLRFVPDLVFLNCCYLGRTESGRTPEWRDRPRLAANLASQFIRIGSRAVIAAGWVLNDTAGRIFAEEFYTRMLDGDPFGRAVHSARARVYRQFPSLNTWGAYQCYGDPGWVLHSRGHRPRSLKRCVAVEEMVSDLRNLSEDARVANEVKLREIRERLEHAEEEAKGWGWQNNASLLVALASGWGEIGQFSKAVTLYEAALRAEYGHASITAAEQLANLRSRMAFEAFVAKSPEKRMNIRGKCLKNINQSIKELTALPGALNAKGGPSERLRLLGSCYKRRSTLSNGSARIRDLKKMAESYRAAEAIRRSAELGKQDIYSILAAVSAEVVLHLLTGSPLPSHLDQTVQTAALSAGDVMRRSPTFWQQVAWSDGELVRRLARLELPDHVPAIVDRYLEASEIGSPRENRSILDHLDWLAEVLASKNDTATEADDRARRGMHGAATQMASSFRARLPPRSLPHSLTEANP